LHGAILPEFSGVGYSCGYAKQVSGNQWGYAPKLCECTAPGFTVNSEPTWQWGTQEAAGSPERRNL
jgi:hypothetical protein